MPLVETVDADSNMRDAHVCYCGMQGGVRNDRGRMATKATDPCIGRLSCSLHELYYNSETSMLLCKLVVF